MKLVANSKKTLLEFFNSHINKLGCPANLSDGKDGSFAYYLNTNDKGLVDEVTKLTNQINSLNKLIKVFINSEEITIHNTTENKQIEIELTKHKSSSEEKKIKEITIEIQNSTNFQQAVDKINSKFFMFGDITNSEFSKKDVSPLSYIIFMKFIYIKIYF